MPTPGGISQRLSVHYRTSSSIGVDSERDTPEKLLVWMTLLFVIYNHLLDIIGFGSVFVITAETYCQRQTFSDTAGTNIIQAGGCSGLERDQTLRSTGTGEKS